MIGSNNPAAAAKAKTRLRIEDLESRLLLTTYAFDPGPAYTNQRDVPLAKEGAGDLLQLEWEASLFQGVKHDWQLELTLNALEAQSITVAAAENDDVPENLHWNVVQPQFTNAANATPVIVHPEASRPDPDGHTDSKDIRPNRRTVKNVLTTRADVGVAVSVAAHMH